MTDIEQLEKKVASITNDLADLKSEVSIDVKKQKEKETFDKIKNTKEEINLQIDALKKLGKEKNAADIKKLEEMITSLDAQSQLKAEVLTDKIKTPEAKEKKTDKEKEVKKEVKKEDEVKKNRFKKQRDGFSDKTEENHARKNTARIAGGIGIGVLVYKWFKKLFGGEEKWNEVESRKAGESKSRWKKALTWAGIWVGWVFAWKNRDKFSDWLGGLFGKEKPPGTTTSEVPWTEPEKQAEKFETLKEDEKIRYNMLAKNINEYQNFVLGPSNNFKSESLWWSEYDADSKKLEWLVPFILNNRYSSIQKMLSESTYYYEAAWLEWHALAAKLKWLWADALKTILMPVADKIDGLGGKLINIGAVNGVDDLCTFIAGNPKLQEHIRSVFRKSITVMSYINSRKRRLAYKLVENKMKTDMDFQKVDADKKAKLIQEKLEDEERMKDNINPSLDAFNTMGLYDAITYLGTPEINILDAEVDPLVKEAVENIVKEKNDILDYDEGNGTVLDRVKEKIQHGSLEGSDKKEVLDVVENILENIDELGKKKFFDKYLPILSLFDPDGMITDQLYKSGQYEALVKPLKDNIIAIRDRLKQWSVSQDDITKLQSSVDDYFSLKRQLAVQNMEVGYTVDENGNVIRRAWMVLYTSGKGIVTEVNLMVKKWWRSREWAGIIIGHSITIIPIVYAVTHPINTLIYTWKAIGRTLEKWLKLGVAGSKKAWILSARYANEYMPSRLLRYAYKGRTDLLQYDFVKWLLSYEDVEKLFKKDFIFYKDGLGKQVILDFDWFLKKTFDITDTKKLDELKSVLKKYGTNKSLLSKLIENKYNAQTRMQKIGKLVNRDKSLISYKIDVDVLNKLIGIDNRISKLTPWKNDFIFWETFLKHTKTLDKVEDFMKNKKMMWLLAEVWSTSDDYVRMSKIIAKNFHQFKTLDELEWYLTFLKTQEKNITHTNNFVRNTIGKRNKLKSMDTAAQAKYIETAKLNTTFLERRINAMKDNFKKSAETLRNLIKNKKTPYPGQVESVANGLDDLAKASNEDLWLLAESERMWTGNRLSSMNKDVNLIKKISPLFKDEIFLKELSKAKTQKAVEELFASKWIDKVPEEFAKIVSETTSTKKLVDTMIYVEKYESLGKIGKILKNPSMKYAGRVLWRALGVWTVVLWWVFAYETYQEWSKLKVINQERGELMQDESFVDIGLTVAGACAFIPGIGWIASGVILAATGIASEVKEAVFDTLDKYNKNYKDFMGSTPLLIKQHILTTALGSAQEDRSFGEWLVGSTSGTDIMMKYLAAKTWSEATKALLYTEEWKKNQLAMIDINDTELMEKLSKETPPITREQVAEAVTQVEKNVESKYEYLKKKCGVYTLKWKTYINIQKVVSVDKIKNGEWMKSLDQLLLECEYAIANPESFWEPEKITQHQKEMKDKLNQEKKTFEILEWLFAKDKQSLFYMYRYMIEYKQHLVQFWFDESGKSIEPQYDAIIKNMEYFDKYMQYKTFDQWIDVASNSAWFAQPNFIITRDFFATLKLDTPIADKEIYNSSSKLQTILYRIATEVIGVKVNNTMEELKNVFNESNEKMYGLYFHDDKLDVNGNYFTDSEYLWTDIATIKKIKTDIEEQVKAGDLIKIWTGTTYLNKEIGDRYLKIIDQEIARV
ncbi:MAG: hypothetical protein ACD_80C00084G0009 [uncultured bacterium (gcode 4)]|uniref:Uncharacterized protein n=1 Tax=uncultured bacterium (gcode 4) TaxID=1234023 RepID=K1XY83_9BACT|nr:MAG: hypothetical protein ACD_80C00084G0009 [uncultured bacterium (gcode 4)]